MQELLVDHGCDSGRRLLQVVQRGPKKRDFRTLWIARLSAAAAQNDISYSRLISALSKANVSLDRKVLAEIAIADPRAFSQIVSQVRQLAPAH